MRIFTWSRLSTALALGVCAVASAQVIVKYKYRPPETVQRVAIPVDPAEKRLRVLIISGRNSYEHDWTGVNNLLRTLLQDTGRFDVRVTEDFDHGSLDMLKAYDVVLLNYSSRWNYDDPVEQRWTPAAESALFGYVRGGGGLVAYHSSFTFGYNWPEYRQLVGAVMQPGTSRRSPPGAFALHLIDRTHPITAGLREYVWTYNDDMYTNMSFAPDTKLRVLATAHDTSVGLHARETQGHEGHGCRPSPDVGAGLRQGARVLDHLRARRGEPGIRRPEDTAHARHRMGGDRAGHLAGIAGSEGLSVAVGAQALRRNCALIRSASNGSVAGLRDTISTM
jgi:uncharacterized protein